jgi:hypothetical protein
MFGSRDQRKGSEKGRGVLERARSVCLVYRDVDQIEPRRAGAREERGWDQV